MKKIYFTLFLALLFTLSNKLYSIEDPVLPGGEYGNDDRVSSMVIDDDKNCYVTGYSTGMLSDKDFCTVKYNKNGVQQWVNIYNGSGNGEDKAYAITVDKYIDIFVTGYSTGLNSSHDITTIKYKSDGSQQWVAVYDGSAHKNDEGFALIADDWGNVYVTGFTTGTNGGTDFCTIKYNSNGVQQWVATYSSTGSGEDKAYAITIDSKMNIYVTGYGKGMNSVSDYITIKYSTAGVQQWVSKYNGTGSGEDKAYAITVDKYDDLVVTGSSKNNLHSYDYATVKYNSNGVQQWVARYSGPCGYGNQARSVAVDNSCNVYVTGSSNATPKGNADFATIKYNSAGVQQWVSRYDGSFHGDDIAYSLALDKKANVFVSGASKIMGPFGIYYHYTIVKYKNSGVQQWVDIYTSSYRDDIAVQILVDNPGNIYVTGSSYNPISDFDYVTLSYNTSGTQKWSATYSRGRMDLLSEQNKNEKLVPDNFVLYQNSPNPFNPSTTIKFDVLKYSRVKLVIYNELGMVVSTLMDDYRDKGSYEIRYNMSDFASGIYFFVMTSNDSRIVKKMILNK
ncbi:MAG: SBBP repeat-containing protein [Ignavibacteria bacterium]|jgi:uncharacterized delta-60 repeat protein